MSEGFHSPKIRNNGHCKGGYNGHTAEISRLLKEAARL